MDKENLNEFKGGPSRKKCFIEGPETQPDILCGGHRIKKVVGSFLLTPLGINSLPGSCAM